MVRRYKMNKVQITLPGVINHMENNLKQPNVIPANVREQYIQIKEWLKELHQRREVDRANAQLAKIQGRDM
jgi:uncharacterized protein (UPF0147 family)